MPRGDGTGPLGAGPMSGRGAGYCAGYGVPGYINAVPGRGYGMGIGGGRGFGPGGGRGWRRMFYATGLPGWMRFRGINPDPEMEKKALQVEAENLQAALDAVKSRLGELEKES